MTITAYEMSRRVLVSRLQSRITDVLGEFTSDGPEGITYAECLTAFHEAMGRCIRKLIAEEWREGEQT